MVKFEARIKTAANSVFIKLWLEVKPFNDKSLFCFCGQLKLMFFKCHNFIYTLTLVAISDDMVSKAKVTVL
jgi:hypothetical protein